ncbi:MAG: class I SAM-dependent methyltransferase [Bacteroidia bacterium]|nr:class I SAM-dependent methyltransferase [Bacteroidia bacterium]
MNSVPDDYLQKNKEAWNQKAMYHFDSEFYDVPGFLNGKNSLREIELALLGEIKDKSILHLQCHFGQDSLSLSRMGAKVTGVDFSENAIEYARILAREAGVEATFVLTDVYQTPDFISEKFDIIFTTYGTIGWLPDLGRWADVIAAMLKPGGKLIFVEFHPVVWMLDSKFREIHYSYFNETPIKELEKGTYADESAPIETETISFNHSLSDVINSLIQSGMHIDQMNEYAYSPYPCFPGMIETGPDRYIFEHFGTKLPLVYAILAHRTES